MATRFLVLALLMLAAPAAAQGALEVPATFRISEATFLAGQVQLEEASVADPVVAQPTRLEFSGLLTVCPRAVDPQGVVRPVLLTALATVRPTCDDAQAFQDPVLVFGPGTRLAFSGTARIEAMPSASLFAPFGDGTVAMTMGGEPARWSPPEGMLAFAAVATASNVTVASATPPVSYTGTSQAFLLEGPSLRLEASALAGTLASQLRATVAPATRQAMSQAIADPFALLDAQEDLLGPDAREPRGNVSAILREFGRTPDYISGSLLGRLQGSLAGRAFDGDLVMVRADRFDLVLEQGVLRGEAQPKVAFLPSGVAMGTAEPAGAPWLWIVLAWIAAGVVLLIRRRAPERPAWLAAAWGASFVAAVALYDLVVLQGVFGAGLLRPTALEAGLGSVLAQAAFLILLMGASYVGLAVPVRLLAGRVLPGRLVPWAEAAWAVVWIALPLLFPAAFFALGYGLARL